MERLKNMYKILLFVLAFLLGIGLVAAYYGVIRPLEENMSQKESMLNIAKVEFDKLTAEKEQAASETKQPWEVKNAKLLKKKLTELPVASQIQQVLLQFEAAEKKSGAEIRSFNFTKIIGENTTGPVDITIDENTTADTAETTENPETNATEQTDGNIDATVKNADFQNLVELHMDILLHVDDYYEIRDFLEAIEKSSRKMTVLSASFEGREEIMTVEQMQTHFINEVHVSIATFFVTGYDELKPYMPVFKVPDGSGKTNPFPVLTEDMIQKLLQARKEELKKQEAGQDVVNDLEDKTMLPGTEDTETGDLDIDVVDEGPVG